MKKLMIALATVLLLGSLAGVVSAYALTRPDKASPIDQTLDVKAGELFEIVLDSNPTTGYSWQARFDSEHLNLVDQQFRPSSGLIGAGGVEVFTFRGLANGATKIEFTYQRPWEMEPLKSQSYTIKVIGNAGANGKPISLEESLPVAQQFIANSPTFRYDGVKGSIELVSSDTLRCPNCYAFTFRFQTAHSGHGDRTGQVLLQVITDHEARVVVTDGMVAQALCDGTWDMLAQVYIGQ